MAIFRGDGGSPASTTEATLNAVTEKANEAAVSAQNAETSEDNAAVSATNAATSATNAAASATSAETAVATTTANANSAATSASNASTSASNALSSANSATTSATAAANSATAASTSATNAANSATAAATSATNAANSATSASTSATNSASSASAASTSATNAAASEAGVAADAAAAAASASSASTSATNAANSATSASSSATSATASATSATSSASAASTSASNASTSETNAGVSEVNAAASESAAASSESNAATSESNAATSATNAATSESNAATSATNAAASFDSFDDRYLGAKASAPTLDNDGDALITGALYYNSTQGQMYVWEGTAWEAAYLPASGYLALTGGTLTGALTLNADPSTNLQAATKQYVDTIAAASLHYHDPVRVEKEGNLSATYNNGSSGVGATLTNNSTQEALVIDGVTLSVSDRVLVYEQTDATQNGIYTVTDTGSASTNWVLTRATDADSYAPSDPDSFGEGDAFFVLEGTLGAGELYVMNTSGAITFGTTNITFAQVSSAQVYTAGTGISISGATISSDITLDEVVANGATTSTAVTVGNLTSTGIDDNATSTAVTLDSSGDVGINITNPTEKLHVGGNILATGTITAPTFSGNATTATTATTATSVASNSVGADGLNVSGNGTTSQFLRSDGDGSFTWATPSSGSITRHAEVNATSSGSPVTFNLGQSFDEGKCRVQITGSTTPYYVYTYYWSSASQIKAWVRNGEGWVAISNSVPSKCVVQEFKQ